MGIAGDEAGGRARSGKVCWERRKRRGLQSGAMDEEDDGVVQPALGEDVLGGKAKERLQRRPVRGRRRLQQEWGVSGMRPGPAGENSPIGMGKSRDMEEEGVVGRERGKMGCVCLGWGLKRRAQTWARAASKTLGP